MLNELRRPIRIDDWNQMIIQFNRLEKLVNEVISEIEAMKPPRPVVELVYNKFLFKPDDFFREEGCMYQFPFTITEDIEDRQQYQLLKNFYVFDKDMMQDIEKELSENKIVHLIVNINEKEKSTKKVAIKGNVDNLEIEPELKEDKPKRKQGRPKKKRWWFGI